MSMNISSGESPAVPKASGVHAGRPVQAKDEIHSNEQIKKMEEQGLEVSIGEKQKVKIIEQALKALEPDVRAEMYYQKGTTRLVIKLLDIDTGELIREIPPEKTQELIEKFNEIKGLLIDEKV